MIEVRVLEQTLTIDPNSRKAAAKELTNLRNEGWRIVAQSLAGLRFVTTLERMADDGTRS